MSLPYDNIVSKVVSLTENYHFSIKQNIYRETLRQLLSIFGNIYYLGGSGDRVKVKCSTGKPDRPTGKDENENNLVLPYITITEIGSEESDERRRVNSLLVNEKIWDEKENRAKRYLSLAPRAINISYQINIWAKYNSDLDQIRYAIFTLFNPSLDIRTKFSDYTKAFVKSEADINSQEAGDTTDRLVQKTITISVETYLPSPKFLFTNTGEIKSLNAEIILKDTRQDATEQVTDIGLGGDIVENDGSGGQGNSGGGVTGPLTLSGSLDDVDITSVTFGDVLLWNGDYWVASAISDIIGGETLNHQLLSNRDALDAHSQYVLSSTNLSLSSAVSSHIASASVHFTSGSLSGAYVLTSTNSNLSSLVSNIQTSTISLSSYIAANESSWSSAGATYLSSLLDVDSNSFPAANKYSVIYNSGTDLFEVRQLQFNDLSDYVLTEGLTPTDNWVLAYTSIAPAGFTPKPLSDLVALDTLNDVDVPNPALNDILQYTDDGFSYQWRNLPASSLVSSIEASTITISSTLESHIGSAVHWELSTLNTNYLNASGDSANAEFYLSSVSATNLSATNYYNLPSSTIVWEAARDIVLLVRNGYASRTIFKGEPVTVVSGTGNSGGIPVVEVLSSVNTHVPDADLLSNHVAGLARQNILAGDEGYIIVEGLLTGLDTIIFSVGDWLYVSSNGQLSNQRPLPPYESHPVGVVTRSQQNNGTILVKIENSPELNDIVGFNLNSNILDGDIISYDLTTSTFVNKQTVTVSGLGRFGTVSATTYQNLPSSTALWNANQLQGINVSSNVPGLYQVLTYDGTSWVPSSVPTGGGGTNDHAALINRELDNAHPQYASSSVSAQINSVSAYASGVSSIVSSHINDSTIHFTSGSLSGAYVLTSTNTNLSSLVTDIQTSSNNLSGVVGAHIGSAVHWDLSTLNSNYINASGDSASAGFYFSSLSANNVSISASVASVVPLQVRFASGSTVSHAVFASADGTEIARLNLRGTNNLFLGKSSGNSWTTGSNNVAIGHQASQFLSTGSDTVAIGSNANYNSATSQRNTSIGSNAGSYPETSTDNVNIGYYAGYTQKGSFNVSIGPNVNYSNFGSRNVGLGYQALSRNTSGTANIGVGYRAGYGFSSTASNNIAIGQDINITEPTTFSNTIVIGSGTNSTDSNQTIIGHPQTSSTIIRGAVSSTSLISNVISGTNISGAIVSATTVSAGTLHLGGSDGYLINNNGSIIISAINGTVRFPQGFELTGTVSAPTISATTYLNLPTSSLSGLADTQITSPTNGQSLIWSSTISKWIASSVAGGAGPGGVTDHGALTGLEDNDHPQYASSSVSAQIESVSAYASGVSSIVSSHIASAVHWELSTLNANYLNASGDSVNASFYLSGLSATNFSATTYQNLPSGSPVWNASSLLGYDISYAIGNPNEVDLLVYTDFGTTAIPKAWRPVAPTIYGNVGAYFNANKIQSINVSSTTPNTSALLVYNGTAWTPSYSIYISGNAPSNNVGNNGDLYFQYGDDLVVSAYILSATNYLNLPTSSLSGLLDTSVTVGNIGTGKSLVWNGSKWIPSSVAGGTGATPVGGLAAPSGYEVQFYKDGGLSGIRGFEYQPGLYTGRIVLSGGLGIENYGSSYFSFLGGETLTLYGANNNEAYLRAGSNDSLSSTAIITPSLSATTISATNILGGSYRENVSSVDGSITQLVDVGSNYDIYLVNTTTSAVTVRLPNPATSTGRTILISKVETDGSFKAVTVSGNIQDNNLSSISMFDPNESLRFISNGTSWINLDYQKSFGIVLVAKNSGSVTLTKGTPLRLIGSENNVPTIGPVSSVSGHIPNALGEIPHCIGLAEHDFPPSSFGHVITRGLLYGLNTNSLIGGDPVYIGDNGQLTNTMPMPPYESIHVGIVVVGGTTTEGIVYVDLVHPVYINDIVGFNLPETIDDNPLDSHYKAIYYTSATKTFTADFIDHGFLIGLSDNDHPQYASSSLSATVNTVSATINTVSGDLNTTIGNVNTVSTTLNNHIASAVHWELATLNTNYLNSSGDSVNASFYLSNLSAAIFSATNYLNLPTSSLSSLPDVDITTGNIFNNASLVWNGSKWTPSAVGGGGGVTTDHQALTEVSRLNSAAHPQYASSAVSAYIDSHIGSAVHWELSSLNNIYLNASGDSASASFYLSSLSATTFSATTYLNLPTSALSGLSDVNIPPNPVNDNVLTWSSTAPGGGKWVAKSFTAAAATNLYELQDVAPDTVPPAVDPFNTDSILRWNSATSKWEGITAANWFTNTQSSITHNSIGGLTTGDPHTQYALKSLSSTAYWNANKLQGTDVTSTAPTTNQALVYDGAKWMPSSLPAGGGGGVTFLSALSDVSAPTPTHKDILIYNSSVGRYVDTPIFPRSIAIHADAGANITLTNQPNTEQFFSNSNRNIFKADLTYFTQARICARVVTQSASVNSPRLYVEYSTTFTTTVGSFLDIGVSPVSASMSTATYVVSNWIDLVEGARADVFFTVLQNGGDGTADPALGPVSVEFR